MRRRRRPTRGSLSLAFWIALSVLLHAAAVAPIRAFLNEHLSGTGAIAKAPPPVKVVRLSAAEWAKNQARRAAPKVKSPADPSLPEPEKLAKAEPPPPEPPKEEKLSGQIVEVPATEDDAPNPEAKLLSKYNSRVEKESMARLDLRDRREKRVTHKLEKKDVANNPPVEAADAVTPSLAVKGDGLDADRDAKPKSEKLELKMPDILRRAEVALPALPGPGRTLRNQSASEAMVGNSDRFELQLGGASAEAGDDGGKKGPTDAPEVAKLPTLAALVPNFGALSKVSGSPSEDHVDGVEEGDGTFLNTKEFKYATFFYRVRDGVSDHWHDLARQEYRRRDPTGNIYGVRDRATLLRIQLTRDGELANISVEQTSGVDFLDDVAMEAFRRAQPFPNPPPGIADSDGQIRFNFQFIITMNANRGLNIFRSYQ